MSTRVIHAFIEMFHMFHMSNLVLHPQLKKKKAASSKNSGVFGPLPLRPSGSGSGSAGVGGGGGGRTAAATLSPRPDRSALILPVLAKMSNT